MPGAHQASTPAASARARSASDDRRVVDDRLPLDQCLLAELRLAVVLRRVGGGAAHRHRCRDEVLWADQFDTEAFEHRRRHVEEIVGLLEFQFDRRRLVLCGEIGEAGHRRRDELGERRPPRRRARGFGVHRRPGRAPRPIGSTRRPRLHHRPGSASSTSSSSTSHGSPASSGSVSRTRPRTTGSPAKRRRWRSSERTSSVTASWNSSRARADDRVVLAEGREDGPQRLHLARALAAEIRFPAAMVQYRARETIDECAQDVGRGWRRAVPADRRRRTRRRAPNASSNSGERTGRHRATVNGPSSRISGTTWR